MNSYMIRRLLLDSSLSQHGYGYLFTDIFLVPNLVPKTLGPLASLALLALSAPLAPGGLALDPLA